MLQQAPSRPAFVIRAAQPTDEGFVANAWAETFRGNPAERRIEPGFFNRAIYPRIRTILERAEVRIAGPAHEEVIYGFAVLEPGCIHMVYTRKPWRRMGVAKALLQGVDFAAQDWSTQSGDFREWIRHKHQFAHYRPFWLTEGSVYG